MSELREAHTIVRQHPQKSLSYIGVVASRLNHPEMADILKTMKRIQLGRQGAPANEIVAASSAPSVRPPVQANTLFEPTELTTASTSFTLSQLEDKVKNSRSLHSLTDAELMFLFQKLDEAYDTRNREVVKYRNRVRPSVPTCVRQL